MPKTVDDLNTRQAELHERKGEEISKKFLVQKLRKVTKSTISCHPPPWHRLMLKGGRKAAQVGCIHKKGRVDITRH